ncbi:hypothetical protein [Burkholderia alba]|uniref:hypothetical protein n=1 Tax=Burkholderia alba TaxID=2683677 RepID=UPI002B0585AD|nr:hypothetical protein [Burkholderia alba]
MIDALNELEHLIASIQLAIFQSASENPVIIDNQLSEFHVISLDSLSNDAIDQTGVAIPMNYKFNSNK